MSAGAVRAEEVAMIFTDRGFRVQGLPFSGRTNGPPEGFTLIELLVVISVLAILASMVLFALAGAEETAKEMRTRATITKLHNLIMQKYESYQTRRVPIKVPPSTDRPMVFARVRLDGLRELMRMEMPDRWTDVWDPSTPPLPTPSVTRAYREELRKRIGPPDRTQPLNPLPADPDDPLYLQQSAECLYLIITKGIDDPDVMEQFSPSEIGDYDNDGFKEFWDAWGEPIGFLRWAPGFVSPMQPRNPSPPYYTEHDPFDPRRVYKPPTGDPNFPDGVYPPLYPLVYSSGADKTADIFTTQDDFHYFQTTPPNNPYVVPPNTSSLFGSLLDETDGDQSIDNITNHDLGL